VTASVIRIEDLRRARNRVPAPVESELQVLLAQARHEGRIEGLYDGMRVDLELRGIEVPTMLPARRLALVPLGGCA
jgi:hypothetical protein